MNASINKGPVIIYVGGILFVLAWKKKHDPPPYNFI